MSRRCSDSTAITYQLCLFFLVPPFLSKVESLADFERLSIKMLLTSSSPSHITLSPLTHSLLTHSVFEQTQQQGKLIYLQLNQPSSHHYVPTFLFFHDPLRTSVSLSTVSAQECVSQLWGPFPASSQISELT